MTPSDATESGAGIRLWGSIGSRLVGERVRLRVERDRPVDVVQRVDDLEVVGGGDRLVGAVLDAHEDAEPGLVARGLLRPDREARQVGAVLDVVRVQVARDLDLVLQIVDVEVGALGLAQRAHLQLVPAARREQRAGQRGGEEVRRARRRIGSDRTGRPGPAYRPPTVARAPRSSFSSRIDCSRRSALRVPRLKKRRGPNASISRSVGSAGSISVEYSTPRGVAGRRERPRRVGLVAVELPAAARRRRSGTAAPSR